MKLGNLLFRDIPKFISDGFGWLYDFWNLKFDILLPGSNFQIITISMFDIFGVITVTFFIVIILWRSLT